MKIRCSHCRKKIEIVNPAAAEPAKKYGIMCPECRAKTPSQRAYERGLKDGLSQAKFGELPY